MADRMEVVVSVPVYKDLQDADGYKYTAYIVRVQTSFGDMWELEKRYSDFADLHAQLQKHYPHLQEFKFPHKSMFNTMADFTKLRRLSGFQEYVKLLMELKPRPVEVDRFLELDEHLLNRNGVTSVTGSAQPATAASSNNGRQAGRQPNSSGPAAAAAGATATSTSGAAASERATGAQTLSEQQRIVRIVISSFVTMILTFWALATAGIIDINTYTTTRMLLTLLSLGSVCTFMRIALLKREQRYASKMKAS